jgi:hypothetical protein
VCVCQQGAPHVAYIVGRERLQGAVGHGPTGANELSAQDAVSRLRLLQSRDPVVHVRACIVVRVTVTAVNLGTNILCGPHFSKACSWPAQTNG